MEPTLNSRLEWLIHLLTQVVLTSLPSVVLCSQDVSLVMIRVDSWIVLR
jgi:hypothetical protein